MNNLIEVKLGSMNYEQFIIFSVNNFLLFSLGRPVSGVHQPSGQEAVRPSSPISSQGTYWGDLGQKSNFCHIFMVK